MMNRVLGLNEVLLNQCAPAERVAYRWSSRLCLLAIIIALLGNAGFGWLLLRNIAGVVLLSVVMTFIHASVLRISFITLMSRPLIDEVPPKTNPVIPKKTFHTLLLRNPLLKPVSLLRIVFVGCIAVSASLPLATMSFYKDALQVEQEYRDAFERNHNTHTDTDTRIMQDFKQSHYPFVMFRKLIQRPTFKTLFILFCAAFFVPLFILTRLRYREHYQYTKLLKSAMLNDVMIDYDETMEQTQRFLDKNHPNHHVRLKELNAFADGPLRHKLKRDTQISLGDKKAFGEFLNSI